MSQRSFLRPVRAAMLATVALVAVTMFGVEAASTNLFGSSAGSVPARRASADVSINALPVTDASDFEVTASKTPKKPAKVVPPPRVSLTAQQQTPKKVTVHRR